MGLPQTFNLKTQYLAKCRKKKSTIKRGMPGSDGTIGSNQKNHIYIDRENWCAKYIHKMHVSARISQ